MTSEFVLRIGQIRGITTGREFRREEGIFRYI